MEIIKSEIDSSSKPSNIILKDETGLERVWELLKAEEDFILESETESMLVIGTNMYAKVKNGEIILTSKKN